MSALRILVADDSRTVRVQAKRTLENAGFEVICACDGAEAVELAQANNPAVAILDIHMPLMDGYAVCQSLQNSHCHVPIIFMTSVEGQALQLLGRALGAYLHKPVQPADLLRAVRSFTDVVAT
jgi:DNA-binding response OmpR family regulator